MCLLCSQCLLLIIPMHPQQNSLDFLSRHLLLWIKPLVSDLSTGLYGYIYASVSKEQIYIYNNVILRFTSDFSRSPRISCLLYLFLPRNAVMCEQEQAFVHRYTHIHRATHTLFQKESQKKQWYPARCCQIAQATRAREDLKELLVPHLTQLIVLLHGHTRSTISAQAWSSSDRPSLVQVLVLTHLYVGTQFSVKPFNDWLNFK